ncbi:ribosome-releasing factor 2, mitochondrial [Cryptotermes secundus]|uniref:ribosome-releasing factor 2, mitochondrial n=1 Tax=Cryptotermes secundus TaxID=105785 RepID=UPI000CD7AAE2|nr:ribosome-releasing factor 2, mitochondrial [Cryptotermes secundus]
MFKGYVLRCGTLSRWMFRGCRHYSQKCAIQGNEEVSKHVSFIRNFGLLAHIDAGKTTTTERMLYYAGSISSMGEVHHGNTVTDYMEEERLRGITISSVAVTFMWNKHRFNLIDTPGHIDFTMEVEQTLGVLDGVVILLDGSAGVEAQTLTVWRQADRYAIPSVIYVNKMDRRDADFSMCVDSLHIKLGTLPLPVQLPVYESGSGSNFKGVIDLITLDKLIWDISKQGLTYKRIRLDPGEELWKEASCARAKLVEQLADLDDNLAELVIQQESLEFVPSNALMESLRRVTLAKQGVPVLCGSSYKNVGVQSLMDAVIHFLPSPSDCSKHLLNCFGSNLVARAFKVIHDDQKGPVTFFRIFSGKFNKGQKIYNITQGKTEQTGKLMVAFADESEEVSEVDHGNIAAITGLKHTTVGDLVTSNASTASAAQKKLLKLRGVGEKTDTNDLFGISTRIPDPVFFCSIEPPSKSYQLALEHALQELQREDPSLHVSQNEETGQTVLGGMGELHLEIIKNRILSEYKIDVELGDLQIAYKETINNVVKDTHTVNHKIGSSTHSVTVTLSLLPNDSEERELLLLDESPDSAANIAAISFKHLHAVKLGVESAMAHGPKLCCPIVNVQVMLHWLEVGKGTSDTIISASVAQCIRKLLEVDGTHLLEPVMNLQVVTNEQNSSAVLADLSRRRAVIQEMSSRGHSKVFDILAPLSELLGYSTDLRTITSGTASFTLEFHCYQPMSLQDEAKAIKSVTGFV